MFLSQATTPQNLAVLALEIDIPLHNQWIFLFKQVRMEAAKCLGELGPADLSTLVMRREESESAENISSPEERLVDQVTQILGQLVQTEALPVKRAACEALYGIMHCQNAQSQSQFSAFLLPFLSKVRYFKLAFLNTLSRK